MTNVCGGVGHPSEVKPGIADTLIYAAGAAAVVNIPASYSWVRWALPLLGNLIYHTQDFCTVDPPPQPTFTSNEYNAFLSNALNADYWSFLNKLKDAVGNAVWYSVCKCSDVTTPAQPALPAPPSTTTFVPAQTLGAACGKYDYYPSPPQPQPGYLYTGIGLGALGGSLRWDGLTISNVNCFCRATGVRLRYQNTTVVAPGFTTRFNVYLYDAGGAQRTGQQYVVTAGGGIDALFTGITPDDHAVRIQPEAINGSGQTRVTGFTELYCDDQLPGVPQSPCCPPDTTVTAMLDHIVKQVDLIQRQGVPFAYVPGIPHSGLTGAGQFAVQGILGLKVTFTTVPPWVGLDVGTPNNLWGLGWLNVGSADGWQPRQWLSDNGQVLLPVGMGAMTAVGYSLRPGVVATITELVREP